MKAGRLLAIALGAVILIGGVYGTFIIRHEKEAHFARTAALQDNLATMRKAIKNFHDDNGRYPHNLNELVPNYIRRIPLDPFTEEADWRVTTEETVRPSSDFSTSTTGTASETYIIDVHSNASGKDATGKPLADY